MQAKEVLLLLTVHWADWEVSYITAKINTSGQYIVKTIAVDTRPKVSIGGLQTVIDYSFEDYQCFDNLAMVILPGGLSWEGNRYGEIADFVKKAHDAGIPVAAISGAAIFLEKHGFLNNIKYTGDESARHKEQEHLMSPRLIVGNGFVAANETAAAEFAYEIYRMLKMYTNEEIGLLKRGDPNGYYRNPGPTKNQKAKKALLLVLFILSFFTLYFALALVSAKTNGSPAITENMWLFFLPLPIPLASLILGIKYRKEGLKTTKNIVVGTIFTILLLIYGSFTFIFNDVFSHDYSPVNRIEAQIDFDLPDEGNISTQDWTGGTQSGAQDQIVRYRYMSDVQFTDKAEISELNAEVSKSELWLTTVNTPTMGMIPAVYSSLPSSAQYDYYMIYNADLKTYNSIPERSGTYDFIFIAYNSLQGTMKIGEYSLEVSV